MPRTSTILVTAFAAVLLLSCACPAPPPPPRAASTGKDGHGTLTDQIEREEWIDKAISLRVIAKVDRDKHQLWTGPRWASLSFEEKTKTASMVIMWCYNIPKDGSLRTDETLHIYNDRTGKIIGSYSSMGLSLD